MQMFRTKDERRVVAVGTSVECHKFREEWLHFAAAAGRLLCVSPVHQVTDVLVVSDNENTSKLVAPRFQRFTAYHCVAVTDAERAISNATLPYISGAVIGGFIDPDSITWKDGISHLNESERLAELFNRNMCDVEVDTYSGEVQPLPYVVDQEVSEDHYARLINAERAAGRVGRNIRSQKNAVIGKSQLRNAQISGRALLRARMSVALDTLSMKPRKLKSLTAFAAKLQRLQGEIRKCELRIESILDSEKMDTCRLTIQEDKLRELRKEYSAACDKYTRFDSCAYNQYFDLKTRLDALRNEHSELIMHQGACQYLLNVLYPLDYKGCYTEFDYAWTMHTHKISGIQSMIERNKLEAQEVRQQLRGFDVSIKERFNELFKEEVKKVVKEKNTESKQRQRQRQFADVDLAAKIRAADAERKRTKRAKAKAEAEALRIAQQQEEANALTVETFRADAHSVAVSLGVA